MWETGRILEADFHVIQGPRAQIDQSIRRVEEIGLSVSNLIFAPLTTARLLLESDQTMRGALVIDLGAGTTDYVLYVDGVVEQSGCLAVGVDDVTLDISRSLHLPMPVAEKLKIEEGNLRTGELLPARRIVLKNESGSIRGEVEGQILNGIIRRCVCAIFKSLKARLEARGAQLASLGGGVHLTGGGSLLGGIEESAQEVFELPAFRPRLHVSVTPETDIHVLPQDSCAVGLVLHGQQRDPRVNYLGTENQRTGETVFGDIQFPISSVAISVWLCTQCGTNPKSPIQPSSVKTNRRSPTKTNLLFRPK